MASSAGYKVSLAAQVLQEQSLLAGVLLPGGDLATAPLSGEDLASLPGVFLGAGLDNRRLSEGQLFVALQGERSDGRAFAPQALAAGHWVLTRAVSGDDPLSSVTGSSGVLLATDPAAALTALARAWRDRWPGRLVGITGSNGKTTTKDLLHALLAAQAPCLATRGNLNSKLGMPVTLLELRAEHEFAVVEMGASAVGHIADLAGVARPELGLITNAGPAHLAEFGSLEGVIQGKGELLDVLPADGHAVLNADSPGFASWRDRCPCSVTSFGLAGGDHRWSWNPGDVGQGPLLELDGRTWPVPLPGRHNGANLVSALLAARLLGLEEDTLERGLRGFQPSANRSRLLVLDGRLVLDDSYNANPMSMRAAVAAAADLPGSGKLVAVLGHMAELGPASGALHAETGRSLDLGSQGVLLAVGAPAFPLAAGFSEVGGRAIKCPDAAEAMAWLQENVDPGDRVLVKGSRSAGLEKLVEKLEGIWPPEDGDE